MNEFEQLKHLDDLIRPKLIAVKNSGNSSTIHGANHFLSLIKSWRRIIEDYKEEEFVPDYKKAIERAEDWLKGLIK